MPPARAVDESFQSVITQLPVARASLRRIASETFNSSSGCTIREKVQPTYASVLAEGRRVACEAGRIDWMVLLRHLRAELPKQLFNPEGLAISECVALTSPQAQIPGRQSSAALAWLLATRAA